MEINEKWNYKECLFFISLVKERYMRIMRSFSPFGGNRECFEQIIEMKKSIYNLQFGEYEEWKKDKLWEYLNDDIEYITLWKFV